MQHPRALGSVALAALALVAIGADPASAQRSIRLSVDVPAAAPAEVYAIWTMTAGIEWLFPGARANIEAQVDGEYRIAFDPANSPDGKDNGTAGCRVLALETDRLISFEWRGPVWASEMNVEPFPTHVTVRLTPTAKGTRVELVHEGFGQGDGWDRSFAFFEAAWQRTLERLTGLRESSAEGAPEGDDDEPRR